MPSLVSPESRFQLEESVRVRDEDKVAFEPKTGCIVELNDLGYVLVKAAQSGMSVTEIYLALAKHYEMQNERLLQDIIEFYGRMVERGFLRAW